MLGPLPKFAVNVTALAGIENAQGLLVLHECPDPLQLENEYPELAVAVTVTEVPAGYDPLTLPPEKDDPPMYPET